MVKELRETLRAMWVRLRRTENWIFGMSQMPLIIEEGTSGIWRYRKWSNGVAECWGEVTRNLTCATAWGNWYVSAAFSEDLPTGLFIEPPIVIPQQNNSAWQTGGVGKSDNAATTTTNTGNWYIFRPTTASAGNFKIVFYVIGSWKATTDTPQNLIDYLYDNHVWDYNYLSNLPKINGQTVSGSKTLADYGFTGEIANDKIGYTTTAPTAANTDGLKIVVLEEEPETRYDGWLYLIKEPEE